MRARDWSLINKYGQLLDQQLKASKKWQSAGRLLLFCYAGSLFLQLRKYEFNSINQQFLRIPEQKYYPYFLQMLKCANGTA